MDCYSKTTFKFLTIFVLYIFNLVSGNAISSIQNRQNQFQNTENGTTFTGADLNKNNNKISKPNIIFFVLDDMGWNDAGWVNKDVQTPTITKLAKEGIILNHIYMQPVCTPSRTALLTGIYPYRTGLQAEVLQGLMPLGLPLKFPTMADKLRQQGYATHAVGKWNQGFCHWNYTPTFRGFESFFGFYQAVEHYYSHQTYLNDSEPQGRSGYDLQNNTKTAWEYEYIHNSIPFVKQAGQIINSHDRSKPLFLYFASPYPHIPHEVPQNFEDNYNNSPVKNFFRRGFMARMSAVDYDIEQVIKALKERKLYDNSIIIFTSDNGGSPYSAGNNYPLRGGKATLYEGGTRVAAFVHSPLLKRKGFVYDGLMHGVDWMPTVIAIAGGKINIDTDGINMWPSITGNLTSPRKEVLYSIVEEGDYLSAAIRVGEWKLIVGSAGVPSRWYKPEEVQGTFVNSYFEYKATEPDPTNDSSVQLYNLKSDPYEQQEVSAKYPTEVIRLRARLDEHRKRGVVPFMASLDTKGDPVNFGGAWTPGWCNAIIEPKPIVISS